MTKANEALDKMAENARELGLDYELPITMQAGELDCTHAERLCAELRLAEQPAQQEPAPGYCKYCKQYTIEESLPAQRTWVGLTNKDVYECEPKADWYDSVEFARAIEAKLKEKNT